MSSEKTDKLRRQLSELRPDQIVEIEVVPPTIEALYEYTKVALDQECLTVLRGNKLLCRKLHPVDDTGYPGLAFAVPRYADPKIFETSIGDSPTIHDERNELYALDDRKSPRDVVDFAVNTTKKDLVVFTHQDVYIPRGWGPRMWRAWQDAERRFGLVGVLGVFGVSGDRRVQRIEAGAVIDQHGTRTLVGQLDLPAQVRTLDGCVLVFRRDSGILPDPELGWHFYDADMCLQAAEKGLKVVAVENWLLHRSNWREPDASFKASEEIFRRKRASALPVEVPCALIA